MKKRQSNFPLRKHRFSLSLFSYEAALRDIFFFVISIKTNVFLFSFTNDKRFFSKKMKEYYQFTLV